MSEHFIAKTDGEYEFNQLASEITIFDRRGRVIWRHRQENEAAPIHWRGVDLVGAPVSIGSYLCKILYGHTRQEVCLPFVFVR